MSIFPTISGQIEEYNIIVIGHLRWNRYFGEGEATAPRGQPSTCTSTLIRGCDAEGVPYALLVDPTLRSSASDYYFDLNRRTGLHARDITHCFVTHEHMDHQAGLNYFPNAVWYAAPPVAEALRSSEYIDGDRVVSVEGEFLPGVCAVPLPGHTYGLHGVAFVSQGLHCIVAGDAVMTRHHFARETTEFQKDAEMAAETIRHLKESADVVIPGHDNLIIVRP
ncbi:MAG TPA: MBL fold metallo-hydrolase [Chloroflexi bacterium]|nr:MBL fold metallo-hydrolase [Chloroflexota bacterium]